MAIARATMATFIAIGVQQGDAFFLKRHGMSVLVDGGHSDITLPCQFVRTTGSKAVTVLVCTHSDADHALGVVGFLEGGLSADQVWLPGSWVDRLEDLLSQPTNFCDELFENVLDAQMPEHGELVSLERIGDSYSTKPKSADRGQDNREIRADINALTGSHEHTSDSDIFGEEARQDLRLLHHVLSSYKWQHLVRRMNRNGGRLAIFLEALSTAHLIRRIVLSALHRGAIIRWFDFNPRRAGGGTGNFLVPINAEEIVRIRRPHKSALEFLALTKVNKQSLVFCSPADEKCPGVLFTSDSDLAFPNKVSWSSGMIITAPHHGSEKNAYAYRRFRNETSGNVEVAWVRSDGRFKKRPGSSYINSPGRHYCTSCRNSTTPKQDVKLIARKGWQPLFTRGCDCT